MTMYTLLISRQLLFERIEWATKEDLIRYLKESGIPCKCKERKAALVTKALASIETELDMVLSGKLNDAPSGRLFRADFRTLQMCQSL